MIARMMILMAIAAGLAVYLATRAASVPAEHFDLPAFLADNPEDTLEDVRIRQTDLSLRELSGVQPEIPPEFDVQVDVDASGTKNRLYFTIRERNGFYVETLRLAFYYRREPDADFPAYPLFEQYFDDYIPANEVRRSCIDLVPAEMQDIGQNIGTAVNWSAKVVSYGRWRAESPDPLPPIIEWTRCR